MSRAQKVCATLRYPVAAFVLAACLFASPVASQVCSHQNDWSFYSQGDYTVRKVRIESPIDFLHAVSRTLDAIKPSLPLQPGAVFSATRASEGREIVRQHLAAADKDIEQSFRLLIVIGRIENCQETGPTRQLDLVYNALTTNYNAYLSHSIESKQSEIERPATEAGTKNASGSLTVKPFFGYNRTSQLYGGGQVTARMPGGIFDSFRLAGSGSTTSNFQELELFGTRAPVWASRFEYRLGYRHSDTPAGNNRLKEGKLVAQVFGATQPLGASNLILRFGASLEGGNLQSQSTDAGVSESIQSSGYGALKTYIGAAASSQNYSFAGSYGLQAGTLGATTSVAFVKHVLDLAATGRFLSQEKTVPNFHKSVSVEARLTGGLIQNLDGVPVAERFFGGNATQNFISGDSWTIRNGPFIRSIPQNRLNGVATVGPIGGTSFYSVNLTVSRPVWGRPIIPKEMAADPEFEPAVDAAKATAREALIATRKNGLPAFKKLVEDLAPLENDLKQIDTVLKSLPQDLPEDLSDAVADVQDDLAISDEVLGQDQSTLPSRLDGFLKVDRSTINKLLEHLETLKEALDAASLSGPSTQIKSLRDSVAVKKTALVAELNQIDFSEATRLADVDMKQIDSVLRTFLHELNLVSISPVAIFDAARIWPDRFGTRYGIGGGVRLSLVNFNVTLGYAINPNPQLQEGRGAFFFSMDVTDIFR